MQDVEMVQKRVKRNCQEQHWGSPSDSSHRLSGQAEKPSAKPVG